MPSQATRNHAQAHYSSRSPRQSIPGFGDTDCFALRTDRQTRQRRSDSGRASWPDQSRGPLSERFQDSFRCVCQAPHPRSHPSLPARQRRIGASASTGSGAGPDVAQAAGAKWSMPTSEDQPLRPAARGGLPPTDRMATVGRARTETDSTERWMGNQRDRRRGTRASS